MTRTVIIPGIVPCCLLGLNSMSSSTHIFLSWFISFFKSTPSSKFPRKSAWEINDLSPLCLKIYLLCCCTQLGIGFSVSGLKIILLQVFEGCLQCLLSCIQCQRWKRWNQKVKPVWFQLFVDELPHPLLPVSSFPPPRFSSAVVPSVFTHFLGPPENHSIWIFL